MREIKYRVWDMQQKTFIYWDDFKLYPWLSDVFLNMEYNKDVIFEQYTRLKDKNGKEIYFNSDKVKGMDCHGIEYTGYIDNSDPYCTMLIWDTEDGGDSIPLHIFAYSEPFEIIGNIHD